MGDDDLRDVLFPVIQNLVISVGGDTAKAGTIHGDLGDDGIAFIL